MKSLITIFIQGGYISIHRNGVLTNTDNIEEQLSVRDRDEDHLRHILHVSKYNSSEAANLNFYNQMSNDSINETTKSKYQSRDPRTERFGHGPNQQNFENLGPIRTGGPRTPVSEITGPG